MWRILPSLGVEIFCRCPAFHPCGTPLTAVQDGRSAGGVDGAYLSLANQRPTALFCCPPAAAVAARRLVRSVHTSGTYPHTRLLPPTAGVISRCWRMGSVAPSRAARTGSSRPDIFQTIGPRDLASIVPTRRHGPLVFSVRRLPGHHLTDSGRLLAARQPSSPRSILVVWVPTGWTRAGPAGLQPVNKHV